MSHYHQDTEQAIRAWLTELQACVRAVDYDRAQKIFAPDVVGFGTYASMAQGLEALRRRAVVKHLARCP